MSSLIDDSHAAFEWCCRRRRAARGIRQTIYFLAEPSPISAGQPSWLLRDKFRPRMGIEAGRGFILADDFQGLGSDSRCAVIAINSISFHAATDE